MTMLRCSLLGIACLFLGSVSLHAQDVVLRASTVGSGGGAASSPTHQVQSTLGPVTSPTILGNDAFLHGVGFWFAVRSEQVPLPVELTAFEARLDGSAVLLTWETASETNNAGFEVQRWISGDTWDVLAFVEGAGSTTEPRSYRHRIETLDVGPYRFRLRQVDLDGTATYSDEVGATVTLAEAYRIGETYPNPFSSRATLHLAVRDPQPVRAELYDLLGRRVAVVHDGPMEASRTVRLTIEGQDLPSGLYLLRVTAETFATTRRLMVVR